MIHLSFPETRVLGCLMEKEATTPEYYPLTLNSLLTACNQTTNREPVTALDDRTVQEAVDSLREKKLATVVFGSGSRSQKYRHNFLDHYELNRRETALVCVLLLRGPQTPGELRQRTERMGGFASLEEVEKSLDELSRGDAPLIRAIPAGLGRKEKRYVHLLSGEPSESLLNPTVGLSFASTAPVPATPSQFETVQGEIAALRAELQGLRDEFMAFRKQFE
ncbi:MAG: YceH family protein [Verrucomicrobiota bacterium]